MTVPNIRIVRYQPAHAAPLHLAAIESHAEVGPWLPWCHVGHTLADAEAFIRWRVERFDRCEGYSFVIESAAGEFLGGCGLNDLDATNRRANLGYWVRTSATGRGVATAAVSRLAEWAFANTTLERLELAASVENRSSQRVAERGGTVHEGLLRRRIRLHARQHDAAC